MCLKEVPPIKKKNLKLTKIRIPYFKTSARWKENAYNCVIGTGHELSVGATKSDVNKAHSIGVIRSVLKFVCVGLVYEIAAFVHTIHVGSKRFRAAIK